MILLYILNGILTLAVVILFLAYVKLAQQQTRFTSMWIEQNKLNKHQVDINLEIGKTIKLMSKNLTIINKVIGDELKTQGDTKG
jgi:hypothetical protein